MRIGYEISKYLKEVKTQEGNDRILRAMMVANALGYHFPIDPAKSAIDNAADYADEARKVISQINENISLDSKLALEIFKQVISIRHELIVGGCDISIMEAAMKSHTAEQHQTGAETVAATALLTNLEFMRAQNGMRMVLSTLASEG
jgi:hypothetical protein